MAGADSRIVRGAIVCRPTLVCTWSKLGCSKQVAHPSALNRSAWDVTWHPCALDGRMLRSGSPLRIVRSATTCWSGFRVVSRSLEGTFQWERLMRVVGGVGIWPSEVKFLDRPKTIISESIRQVHPSQSRTKVGGSKMIRYRRSPDRKRCQPGIGRRRIDGPSGTPGET